jgi:UDP-N-acetylglucosamine--N-acetylmuramyl-(pentapeptide) pyrophosphoryl-undecaprenol N-acetylglucosamine transferase
MRVLMSGGRTAGHVNPALAVAALLADARDDVLFVGTPGGLEARLVPEAGLRFVGVPARGFDRSRPLTAVSSAFGIARSTLRCRKLLRRERPDVVVCFGAFVSAPVGLAAASMRVPLVLHEQNSTPGLANRLLARFATVACVTHEESAAYFARARQSRR